MDLGFFSVLGKDLEGLGFLPVSGLPRPEWKKTIELSAPLRDTGKYTLEVTGWQANRTILVSVSLDPFLHQRTLDNGGRLKRRSKTFRFSVDARNLDYEMASRVKRYVVEVLGSAHEHRLPFEEVSPMSLFASEHLAFAQGTDIKNYGAFLMTRGVTDYPRWSAEMLKWMRQNKIEVPQDKATNRAWHVWLSKVYEYSKTLQLNYMEKHNLPEFKSIIKNMMARYHRGESLGASWYDASTAALQSQFGEDWQTVAGILAATSPQVSVDENVRFTLNIYSAWKQGKEIPITNKGLVKIHMPNVGRALRGEPLSGPKVEAFRRALLGDKQAVVLDTHMMWVFFPDKGHMSEKVIESLNENEYAYYANFIRWVAKKKGVEPRDAQAILWVGQRGVKKEETKPSDLGSTITREKQKLSDSFYAPKQEEEQTVSVSAALETSTPGTQTPFEVPENTNTPSISPDQKVKKKKDVRPGFFRSEGDVLPPRTTPVNQNQTNPSNRTNWYSAGRPGRGGGKRLLVIMKAEEVTPYGSLYMGATSRDGGENWTILKKVRSRADWREFARDRGYTMRLEKSKRVASYAHSFSPEFYYGEGDTPGMAPSERPTNLYQAIMSLKALHPEEWIGLLHELYPSATDDVLEHISAEDVMEIALDVNTVGNLDSPVEVYLDPEGRYTVEVYDEESAGSNVLAFALNPDEFPPETFQALLLSEAECAGIQVDDLLQASEKLLESTGSPLDLTGGLIAQALDRFSDEGFVVDASERTLRVFGRS